MKRFTIIFLLLYILVSNLNAQWIWQNPLPQGNTLNDVNFYNENIGLIVGNTGTIMKTTDGGQNWRIIESNFDKHVKKLQMINPLVAYAMGLDFIIKTNDGGESWFNIQSPPLNYLNDFNFINESVGYVIGLGSSIYKTSNSGNSWTQQTIGTSAILYSIDFLNENIGMSAGYTNPNSDNIIVMTTDGGLSWSNYTFSYATLLGANDMIVLSELKTFIVVNTSLLKTTDGGNTWNWTHFSSGSYVLSIDFQDSLNGYISSVNKIIKTTDGGNTWTEKNINIGNNIWLYGVSSPSQELVFTVGLSGRMSFSSDGGTNWSHISSGSTIDFSDITFFDELHGIAVGGGSAVTTDGGEHWITTQGGNGNRCTMPSQNLCFTAGGYNLAKSTDGGLTWTRHPISDDHYFMTISFADTLNGIASAVLGPQGKILRTSDGGETWNQISSIQGHYIYDICFVDSTIAYACSGSTKVFKTTDGGYSWTLQETGFSGTILYGVHFINPEIGFTVGGRNILKTTDGGLNWTNINSGIPSGAGLNQVHFKNELNGITAGKIFAHTSDGGMTWQTKKLAEDFIKSGTMINDSVWFAAGLFGTILKYNIPGVTPVQLISFSADIIKNSVCLNWLVASENNNSGYEVVRNTINNKDWKSIGFIEGKGTITETQFYSFVDENLSSGKYQYRLKQIDFDGTFTYSNIVEVDVITPHRFSLEQNYPNPFNPATKIRYNVADAYYTAHAHVTLRIFDVIGNEIVTLVNEDKPAGSYEVEFDASNLSSGVYYYQLQAGDFISTKKMLMIK